mmetsp:Transcript_19354/g.48366  ORF Transcript_19354/g.48366 Transcript_19354/m.48366 type:complete len:202 (+) Transcript_19354:2995-3600(+)
MKLPSDHSVWNAVCLRYTRDITIPRATPVLGHGMPPSGTSSYTTSPNSLSLPLLRNTMGRTRSGGGDGDGGGGNGVPSFTGGGDMGGENANGGGFRRSTVCTFTTLRGGGLGGGGKGGGDGDLMFANVGGGDGAGGGANTFCVSVTVATTAVVMRSSKPTSKRSSMMNAIGFSAISFSTSGSGLVLGGYTTENSTVMPVGV